MNKNNIILNIKPEKNKKKKKFIRTQTRVGEFCQEILLKNFKTETISAESRENVSKENGKGNGG